MQARGPKGHPRHNAGTDAGIWIVGREGLDTFLGLVLPVGVQSAQRPLAEPVAGDADAKLGRPWAADGYRVPGELGPGGRRQLMIGFIGMELPADHVRRARLVVGYVWNTRQGDVVAVIVRRAGQAGVHFGQPADGPGVRYRAAEERHEVDFAAALLIVAQSHWFR